MIHDKIYHHEIIFIKKKTKTNFAHVQKKSIYLQNINLSNFFLLTKALYLSILEISNYILVRALTCLSDCLVTILDNLFD